jgi:hypothetical protein
MMFALDEEIIELENGATLRAEKFEIGNSSN